METSGQGETVRLRPRRRRGRQLFGLALGLVILGLLASGVIRTVRLWGVPGAPEPFDVAAFEATSVPDEQNAFVLFRKARQELGDPSGTWPLYGSRTAGREWIDSESAVRDWVAMSRPALEVWRSGTDRPDARVARSAAGWSSEGLDPNLPNWLRLALMEANRLEEAGDLAGAWRWHKARLRAPLLIARRGGGFERGWSSYFFEEVAHRARGWAEHDEMTAPLLRAAIADVEAMASLHGSEADSLKRDYLQLRAEIADPWLAARIGEPTAGGPTAPAAGLPAYQVPLPQPLQGLRTRVDAFLAGEPERSRRVARMVYANWLAQADRRPADRAKAISTDPLIFDEAAATVPVAPVDLARLAAAAPMFQLARHALPTPPGVAPLSDRWPKLYATDRRVRAGLIVSLAGRLYEVETGATAADDAQLVGKVLPKLPDDYVPPDGGTAPAGPQ